MKKKYLIPDSCPVEMTPEYMLAASQSVGGTGQDYSDPTTVTEADFNLIF